MTLDIKFDLWSDCTKVGRPTNEKNLTRDSTIPMQLYEMVRYVSQNRKYRDENDKCFCYDSKLYSYDEDTWTERLYYILKKRYSAIFLRNSKLPVCWHTSKSVRV